MFMIRILANEGTIEFFVAEVFATFGMHMVGSFSLSQYRVPFLQSLKCFYNWAVP